MDFALNEKQIELLKKMKEVIAKEVAPRAALIDKKEIFPSENMKALAEAGCLGLPVPAEFGGGGCCCVTAAAVLEEIAVACASTSLCVASSWVCAAAIANFGSEELKKKWLPEFAAGRAVGAYAVTDPEGGHLSDISTKAAKAGDGFKISGKKAYATNAGIANVIVVFAILEGKPAVFAVEKGMAGLKAQKPVKTLGMHGALASEISLRKCELPSSNMLACAGEDAARFITQAAGVMLSAISTGIGRAAYEEAKKYAENRVSGGKPIGAYQEVAFRVADMFIEADTARQLTMCAAWQMAEKKAEAGMSVSIAKVYSSEMAVKNSSRAVQTLGGLGYTRNSPVERFYRDARFAELADGTNELHRFMIADEMLKD